jgi:hypothetical protein
MQKFSPNLPLFAQLYIQREVIQFKAFYYNQLWLPYLLSNIGVNLAYFVFQRKFLFNRRAELFSLKRILGVWAVQYLSSDYWARKLFADNYYVNINVLLDQDDRFLTQNQEYQRLIKTVLKEHHTLVNPNFDIKTDCELPAHPRVD